MRSKSTAKKAKTAGKTKKVTKRNAVDNVGRVVSNDDLQKTIDSIRDNYKQTLQNISSSLSSDSDKATISSIIDNYQKSIRDASRDTSSSINNYNQSISSFGVTTPVKSYVQSWAGKNEDAILSDHAKYAVDMRTQKQRESKVAKEIV